MFWPRGPKQAGSPPAPGPARRRRRPLLALLSVLGVAALAYVLGAAVMHFNLPSSSFLRQAFVGGQAWYETELTPERPTGSLSAGRVDQPDKTCDGFTLCIYGGGSQAVLLDMAGRVVHRWQAPFSTLWADPPHVRGPVDDARVHFNDAYLYPNGDLLALFEGPSSRRNASSGYGLVKLDRDSHVLWKYAANCHHDLDVGEDGTIYVLTNGTTDRLPPALEDVPTPCLVDFVDVLSPSGERRKRISLVEAFEGTPYAALLTPLERQSNRRSWTPPGMSRPSARDDVRRRDLFHTNAVKVLPRALAPRFPLFRAGQLLVSLRHLDALAVLDPDGGKVVWGARGPWHAQHSPTFLGDGRLLLFDNLGSARGSRVLEYDPRTQAVPWSYPGEQGTPFYSRIRGQAQRLPNGNTLIVNSDAGEAFEVTPGREVVWSCSCGGDLYRARRYTPNQVPFVKRGPRAGP